MTDKTKDAFAAYLAILYAAGEITEDQGIRICEIIKENNSASDENAEQDNEKVTL